MKIEGVSAHTISGVECQGVANVPPGEFLPQDTMRFIKNTPSNQKQGSVQTWISGHGWLQTC